MPPSPIRRSTAYRPASEVLSCSVVGTPQCAVRRGGSPPFWAVSLTRRRYASAFDQDCSSLHGIFRIRQAQVTVRARVVPQRLTGAVLRARILPVVGDTPSDLGPDRYPQREPRIVCEVFA